MTNIVLETVSEIREALVMLVQDPVTPKEIRSGGSKVGLIDEHRTTVRNVQETQVAGSSEVLLKAEIVLEDTETALQELPWNSKAKGVEVLETAIKAFDELEDSAEGEKVQAVARLPELEAEITENLRVSAGALVKVGHLLNEAREEFDSAKDFLAWAFERFEFKKAYVYRLMKVADEFPEDDSLAGQSINVLHKLAGMPEEVKQKAREQVEQGESLSGQKVQDMAEPEKPEPVQDEPESTGVDSEEDWPGFEDGDSEEVTGSGPDLGQGDTGAPWDAGTGSEVSMGAAPEAVPDTETPEVKRLRELVSELQAELAAARQERENKSSGKAKAPVLPQFNSDCMYARLGLSAEQGADPAEVRKAFRALVKAGYNSQHESYAALVEAKDTLMTEESKAA